ncbi:MAG: alpha-1,2-fucosyltransferase [Ferruginibacter sp.]
MIVAKLMGGMGNQMFQYAFGKYLAVKHNTVLKLDTAFLLDRTPHKEFFVFRDYDLDIFNLQVDFANAQEVDALTKRLPLVIPDKILNKLVGVKKSYVIEPHFHFSEQSFAAADNSYIEGYWQTEKYFTPIKEQLKRDDFSFKDPLSDKAKLLATEIQNINSVCVNIRRADFVVTDFHGTCNPEYYKKGEDIICSKVADPHYFVFSDEIDWCRENIKFAGPVTYVGHEYAGPKFQDYLRLMATCRHYIIPNSSFAWWAVWLNEQAEKTVIAPQKWFNDTSWNPKDLIPNEWIKI